MTGNRDFVIDIAKGIGILCVIVSHTMKTGNWLFSFHMPLFFIISGLFYRDKRLKQSLKSDFKRLVIPYLITCFGIIIFYFALSIHSHKDLVSRWILASFYGNGSPNHSSLFLSEVPVIGAIWFLLALFVCKNSFLLIHRAVEKVLVSERKRNLLLFSTSLAVSIIAIFLDRVINLPWAILPGLNALLFYWVGYRSREFYREGVPSVIGIVGIVLWILSAHFSSLSIVRCYYQFWPLDVLGAIGGSYAIIRLSKMIIRIPFMSNLMIWVGQSSLALLCIHLLEMDTHFLGIIGVPYSHYTIPELVFCLLVAFVVSKVPVLGELIGAVKPKISVLHEAV